MIDENGEIGASSAEVRAMLHSVVMKKEFLIEWSIYVPTLTCAHEVRTKTKRQYPRHK